MKSSLALLAATVTTASAVITTTDWVIEVVTVTVTAEPTDFVQNSKPTPTATVEPVTTETAAPSAPPAPVANAAAAEEPETTSTEAPAPPPPTSTPEPEPVVQTPEPEPVTSSASSGQTETLAPAGNYKNTVVNYHNAYRKDHSAPDLEWDDQLAEYARISASKCVFEHDMSLGIYGQNLASFGASGNIGSEEDAVGKAIATQWYAGEVGSFANFYGEAQPGGSFSAYGHFTQLVWKESTKVGCVTVHCPAGSVLPMPSYYSVCNYSPPGNFQGKYAQNVSPPLGLKINLST